MALFIIIGIIILVIAYIILEPYFIKEDTTLLFTGGLGTGKTLNAVRKKGKKLYKKALVQVKWWNWKIRQVNKIRNYHNKKVDKRIKAGKTKRIKYWYLQKEHELPRYITNIPVLLSKRKNKWSTVLTKEMLLLKERIPEYSVTFIDEFPQLINQFNWSIKEVQDNVNEFSTFYRHYIGGKLILTAQADSEIVKQVRSKMNTYYHLSNFQKHFFGLFYSCDVCQLIASEVVENVSMGFYEDNTKRIYGILIGKVYDSRCYSERYDKLPPTKYKVWTKFKTNKIIRFSNYESPLDDKETK